MLDKVVEFVKKHPKISDFHLRSKCAFSYRLLGEIQSIQENTVKKEQIEEILNKYCSKDDVDHFNSKNELDSGFTVENIRFRANFYKTLDNGFKPSRSFDGR